LSRQIFGVYFLACNFWSGLKIGTSTGFYHLHLASGYPRRKYEISENRFPHFKIYLVDSSRNLQDVLVWNDFLNFKMSAKNQRSSRKISKPVEVPFVVSAYPSRTRKALQNLVR